jgi:hypothetical protein
MLLFLASSTLACSSPTGMPEPSEPPGAVDGTPPASAGHNLVYADHVGMVVLVNAGLGGASRPPVSTHTRVWGWTGAEWRLLDAAGPPVRNLAGVAYDTSRQVLVMHGGTYDLGRSYGETWEWAAGWRQVVGPGPGVRDHTQLAFDARRGHAVLFGGSGANPNQAFSDTWEFDGAGWARVAADGPPARVHHAMQYDPTAREVVLYGGVAPSGSTLADTWAWDGSRWTSLGSAVPRSHARMAFDRNLEALLVAGGLPTVAGLDMLAWSGAAWTPVAHMAEPSARYLTDVAYDRRRNVLVLFGGGAPDSSTLYDDTWEFDGSSWQRIR